MNNKPTPSETIVHSEAELKYRALFEQSPDGILILDSAGNILDFNANAHLQLGYTREEFAKLSVADLDPVETPDEIKTKIRKMMQLGKAEHDVKHKTKQGEIRDVHVISQKLVLSGKPVLHEVWRDITHRKAAEALIRESENKFRSIFEQTIDGIMIADPDKKMNIEANRAMCDMLGYTRDELVHLSIADMHPKEDLPRILALFAQQVRGEISLAPDIPMLRKDGSVVYADVNAVQRILHGKPCLIGVFRDITERKKLEMSLQARDKQLAESQRIAHVGSWEHNLTTGEVFWSDELFRLLGLDPVKEPGDLTMFFERIHPEDQPAVKKGVEDAVRSLTPFNVDYRFILKDGTTRILNAQAELITDATGTQKILRGTCQDITERKQAEKKLEAAAKEWQASFDAMSDGVSIHSTDHTIINANQTLSRLLGKTREELIGKKCYQVFHGMERPIDGCPLERSRETKKTDHAEIFEPLLNKWLEVSTSPILEHAGGVMKLVHIVRDVTSRKQAEEEHRKLEEQLQHAQKLEGIGQLAGGIAHDFNNVLSAVVGFAGLLQMKIDKADPLRHYADEIAAAAQKGAALTHQILAISRKQVLDMKPANLNEIIRSLEKMLHRLVREDINIEITLFDKDLLILADASQIDQVLINLATNARDAMPKGGKLSIATEPFVMNKDFIQMHGYGSPGEYALLTVSDTGSGMDAETRTKIFEPFFTTKEVGQGTGLGLAVVHGIVKQHGGFIDVYSEVGKGTNFKIHLPLTVHVAERAESKSAVEIRGGTETILIAEDDATLRQLSTTVLSHYGYTVIEAVDGEDAIRKFVENREKIKCVILDGIMPKKNGKEALDEIHRRCPEMKCIFVSGYAEDIFTHDGIPDGVAVFLQKPVKPDELINKMREVLDK